MKVELFYSPGCGKCDAALDCLRSAAEQTVPGIEWRELNVLEEIDHAVDLGVLTLPAVAIEGELVFSALPTPAELVAALRCRQSKSK